ncbi:hypothetical protein MPS_1158 [Mycobacterium pseudoshottsii JCM 15466]|nr:hypothetical protein MPS_1158 [Mycobacterium pseudoshottsii JCM 15466]
MLACSKRRRPSRFVFQDPMGLDTNLAEVGAWSRAITLSADPRCGG